MRIRPSAVAIILTLAAGAHSLLAADPVAPPAPKAPGDILPILERNADAQLAAMNGKAPADWTAATFYVGLATLARHSTDPKYAKAAFDIAQKNEWTIRAGRGKRRFFADDEAIGQLYIALAISSHSPDLLKPLISEANDQVEAFSDWKPAVADPSYDKNEGTRKMEPIAWWWCDSLFMNPPVLAGLSHVTGDKKYIDAMDTQYWKTADLLYDKEEHLFYRDNRFIGQKAKNGQKVFWSRGDGWVMGGLCQLLPYMPADYPSRPKYETLFKDMAHKLVTLQGDNGLWSPSLLDPEDPHMKETSGSAFFTYAFAWGVNHGLLEKEKFEPAIHKGWAALVASLRPDGQLGFVQPVGYKPENNQPITLENSQYYGNGAFLLAGTELLNMQQKVTPAAAK